MNSLTVADNHVLHSLKINTGLENNFAHNLLYFIPCSRFTSRSTWGSPPMWIEYFSSTDRMRTWVRSKRRSWRRCGKWKSSKSLFQTGRHIEETLLQVEIVQRRSWKGLRLSWPLPTRRVCVVCSQSSCQRWWNVVAIRCLTLLLYPQVLYYVYKSAT